jgi:hypothetical protein
LILLLVMSLLLIVRLLLAILLLLLSLPMRAGGVVRLLTLMRLAHLLVVGLVLGENLLP